MTEHELLVAARALIADPKNWTQEVLARDAAGIPVAAYDANALCWCSMGALWFVDPYDRDPFALEEAMGGDIAEFNDTHTHAEVLAAFDRAIAATEGV